MGTSTHQALWGPGGAAMQDYLYGDEDSLLNNYSGTTTSGGTTADNNYQSSAISSNRNNVSDISKLTDAINTILQAGQFNANYSRIPQEYALETKSSQNISDALSGQLGQDVIDQIANAAAERGVSSGSPLGASTNADYLRALGLNSLNLQNTGQTWLNSAVNRNPAAQTMDPTTMLVTPTQQAQQSLAEQELALKERELELEQQKINKSGYSGSNLGGGYRGGGSSYGGSNNYSSLNPYLSSGTKGTGTTSTSTAYNPDTWSNWENDFWDTGTYSPEYYDISGLIDTGGVDFLDWAGTDYYA